MPAIDKAFDYLVPPAWEARVGVGSRVRVALGPRRVGGWVVADGVEPPAGVTPIPLSAIRGWGPSPEVIDLARWAAWRWAGRTAHFLATASPERIVHQPDDPAPPTERREGHELGGWPAGELVGEAISAARAVLRWAPAYDTQPVLAAFVASRLAGGASVMVLAPSRTRARQVGDGLAAAGWPVALMPAGWPGAAGGGRVVVGTRSAAFAPAPALGGVLVLDAHDQAYLQEQAPTWSAWEVAAERADRAGAPCVLVSACPSLEMLAWGTLVHDSRRAERQGWAVLEVVDRRKDDTPTGLLSSGLVDLVRSATDEAGGQVLCVLNRTGRSRLLACGRCRELARCEACGGALVQPGRSQRAAARAPSPGSAAGQLSCRRCHLVRPAVCAACGSTRLKNLRPGVARIREELEALAGVPVDEVSGARITGASTGAAAPRARVVVGTEAVLHRVARARAVAFLDFDQELLAPRFTAGEAALALLARASAIVGMRGTSPAGRVLVQTRLPAHEVLAAALHGDPGRLAGPELERRQALRLPPVSALALVSGPGAQAYVAALSEATAPGTGLEILGPDGGAWLLRAADHRSLADALAQVPRPRQQSLRVELDPLRV